MGCARGYEREVRGEQIGRGRLGCVHKLLDGMWLEEEMIELDTFVYFMSMKPFGVHIV